MNLNERNIKILRCVLEGESYKQVGFIFHLSANRIRQIFYTQIRKLWGNKKYRESLILSKKRSTERGALRFEEIRVLKKSLVIKKYKNGILYQLNCLDQLNK